MIHNKDNLLLLHLTDLRRYAKEIGVKHPTTYTKNELINRILDIESGNTKPSFSKLGRPIKATLNLNTQYSYIKPINKEIILTKKQLTKLVDETKLYLKKLINLLENVK